MENLIKNIRTKCNVTKELEQAIREAFVLEKIPKNDYLLKEQQYCRKLYYLEEGTIRSFYYDKGKDVTSWFYHEDQFFTSWYAFYSQQPGFEYIEALDDCTVYSIDYFKFQKLFETHPRFERFGRILAEEQSAFVDLFSKGYMFMTAKEKYDLLHEMFPDVSLRVNLGHIASFLGITQETLSRIRKKG